MEAGWGEGLPPKARFFRGQQVPAATQAAWVAVDLVHTHRLAMCAYWRQRHLRGRPQPSPTALKLHSYANGGGGVADEAATVVWRAY